MYKALAKGKIMSKNFKLLVSALALAAASTSPALADDLPTAREHINWLADPETKQLATISVHSYSQAFNIANSAIYIETGEKLFCQPEKLALTAEQAVSMLKKYVAEKPEHADEPMGIVLLLAFKTVFPCN